MKQVITLLRPGVKIQDLDIKKTQRNILKFGSSSIQIKISLFLFTCLFCLFILRVFPQSNSIHIDINKYNICVKLHVKLGKVKQASGLPTFPLLIIHLIAAHDVQNSQLLEICLEIRQ